MMLTQGTTPALTTTSNSVPTGIVVPNQINPGFIGDQQSAGDLYGIGVRVGIYSQAAGMLLSMVPGKRNSGAGIKLAASANMIAILISWFIVATRRTISPCETQLVLTLAASLANPATCAIQNPDVIIGEGIGIFFVTAALGLSTSSLLWFWIKLYKELPILGTKNRAWFFANVSITGWFRGLMLFQSAYSIIVLILFLLSCWGYFFIAFKGWYTGSDEEAEEKLDSYLWPSYELLVKRPL